MVMSSLKKMGMVMFIVLMIRMHDYLQIPGVEFHSPSISGVLGYRETTGMAIPLS